MAFAPDQARSIQVPPLPQSDPLLEFSSEENRTPVDAAPGYKSASRAGRAFMSKVVLDATRCLMWLSTSLANLKIGLYERAGARLILALCSVWAMLSALVKRGYAFTSEVAQNGRRCLTRLSTGQGDLRLWPSFAWATLRALVTRGSAFPSRRTFRTWRALVPYGYGLATGVVVTLYLPVLSIPGATVPAPGHAALSQPASWALNVALVPSIPPPVNARSVGAGTEPTVRTAGGRKPDQTSAVLPSRPPAPSPQKAPPAQPATPTLPKLTKYSGSLEVDSAPNGALVLVNGVPVGTTPLLLKDLPVGSRVVRLELDGYKMWSSAVRVVANQRVHTAVNLQPSPSNN